MATKVSQRVMNMPSMEGRNLPMVTPKKGMMKRRAAKRGMMKKIPASAKKSAIPSLKNALKSPLAQKLKIK